MSAIKKYWPAKMAHYDYIIAGAGCAGLSLLVRMIQSGRFTDKRILLVDKAPKQANDRTWCYWEQEPGIFESIVYRKWNKLYVHTKSKSVLSGIAPYEYKMIRGIDFYNYCFALIEQQPNIDLRYGDVTDIATDEGKASLTILNTVYTADYIFSSILPQPIQSQKGRHYLLQHFKGWVIETEHDCFDTEVATLMDFRVTQQHGASFVYMLPLAGNKAMIEYTVFSKETLEPGAYDTILSAYINTHLPGMNYRITDDEYGVIPMTNHRFVPSDGRIVYLGTAGGQTKPSSGYTFRFIQEHTKQLTDGLIATGHPGLAAKTNNRFLFYDTVLLRILSGGKVPADTIFGRLFDTNNPQRLLRFLDNTSTPGEELQVISALPTLPFLGAAIKEIKTIFKLNG